MKKLFCIVCCAVMLFAIVGCKHSKFEHTEHDYVAKEVVEPTCTNEGYTRYSCSVCHYTKFDDYVPALANSGHSYDSYVCDYCGDFLADEAPYTESLNYSKLTDIDGNEYYRVIGVIDSESKYVKIPSEYDGIPVKEIGENAFRNLLKLQHVIVPDGMISIGESAFHYCFNLRTVVIPDSVTEIGKYAFWSCRIEGISLRGVTEIGDGAFSDCQNLTEIEIPEGVASIGVSVFEACYSLESVKIPSSIKLIYHAAFANCRNLKKINFNGTIEKWYAIPKETGTYTDGTDASWDAGTGNYTVRCTDGYVVLTSH